MSKEIPLTRFPFIRTTDVDQAREALARVYTDGKLAPVGSGKSFSQQFNVVSVGGVTLTAMGWGCGMTFEAPSLEDCFDFSSVVHGASQIRVGGEVVNADLKCAVVMSPTDLLHIRWEDRLVSLNAKVQRSTLESHLAAIVGMEINEPLEFSAAMPISGARATVHRLIRLMADEVNQHDHLLTHSLVAERFSDALLSAVLYAQPNNYSDALAATPQPAMPRYVHRAAEYIEAHCDEPITAQSLATAVGVSLRTLHAGFRNHRGCTPMEFLRSVRLRRVRAALLVAPPGSSVGHLAVKWGFNHLGRFSAQYRRQFGENPSDTLRRAAHRL